MVLLATVLTRQRFATNIAMTHIKNCHRSSYPIRLLCSVQYNTSSSPVLQLGNSSTNHINPLIFQPLNNTDHVLSIKVRGFTNDISSRRHRYQDPDMRVCQSIEELTQMAYKHKDSMSPRAMSAYWTLVSKLLRQRSNNRPSNLQIQIDELIGQTLRSCEIYNYRDLTTIAISLAKIINKVGKSHRRQHKGSTEQILQDVLIGSESKKKKVIFNFIASVSVPILHEFEPRNISNFIYAFGLVEEVVLVEDGSTFFDMLAEEILSYDNLDEFLPQHLSNILWAYATANQKHPKLFKKVGDHIVTMNNLDEFWPQALSNTLWAYATLDEQHPILFEKVAGYIVQLDNLNDFWPQALKDLVWAYATVEESHPQLYKKIADHIISLNNLHKFEPQELSIILWAFATASELHPQLFKKIADHIIKLPSLDKFIPQHFSNTVWAFATAGMSYPQLFKKMADHIITLDLNKFKPQHLSNTLWAFATAEEKHPQLYKKVADYLISLDSLRLFKEQNLSNIVWAYAKAGETHSKLFKKVADYIITLPSLDKFKPQHLSNIVLAFATARESHPQLFNKLADEAIKRQHDFIAQGIANFLWAYASNGQVDKHLLLSLVPSVKAKRNEYTAQGLANVAWVYSVADVNVLSVFNNEFINSCLNKEDEFILEALRQLHQWQLWQDELKSDVSLPESLQKRCYEAFISEDPTPSKFQDDVVSILSSMGLQPQEEVVLKSAYRIDAVVEVNGKQIAVEVDGPFHFIGRELTGSTILKHRQVAALDGMPVVSVPYWEWDKLKKDSRKKEQYLKDLLDL